MKKRSSHFFDWNEITKEIPNGKNKGVRFEDLVEELLKEMFKSEKWYRTGTSYDGKKDFAYPDNPETPDLKWAECKNYKDNLSINIISPTLVMGAIDEIKSIIFFSYSELNENAVEGLLRYIQITGTEIKIYDGLILESLIYEHRKAPNISKFFPTTDFERAFANAYNQTPQIVKLIRDVNGNKIKSDHKFERGESFYLTLIIRNHLNRDVNCRIVLFENEKISCSKNSETYKMKFGESAIFSIRCEAILSGQAKVKCKIIFDSIKTIKSAMTTFNLDILDSQYLFWAGQGALDALQLAIKHLKGMERAPLIICAPPNTGKTTLLSILTQDIYIQEHYKILTVDVEISRTHSFKEVLMKLFDISFRDNTPSEQTEEEQKIISVLSSEYVYSANEIAETLMSYYQSEKPYLIVMDDANNMNRAYEDLLYELDLLAENSNQPVYYIYAVDNKAVVVDDFIEQISRDPLQADSVNIISLCGFDKNDITTYLKHKFGLDNIYDCFASFEGKISPIELHRFSKRIRENEIIVKSQNCENYQIVDYFLFSDEARKLLSNGFSVNNFLSGIKDRKRVEFLLKYLYIAGELSYEKAKKYHGIMKKLISFGIVVLEGEHYFLAGDEIKDYIQKNITFSDDDYVDIYAKCFDSDVAKTICALHAVDFIKDADRHLFSFFSNPCSIRWIYQKSMICRLIFEKYTKLKKYKLHETALEYVKDIFESLKIEQGHTSFLELLKIIADMAMSVDWDTDENSVEIISYFIKKLLDRCLSTHNNDDCLKYYNALNPIINDLKYITDDRKFYWMSHYSNRAAVAMDRGRYTTAGKIADMYKLSREYCEKSGNPSDLVLQITIDEFNRHYYYHHDLDNTVLSETKDSLDYFGNSEIKSKTLPIFHKLLIEYLQAHLGNSSFSDADIIKDFANRVAVVRQSSTSAFFIIKLYLLEIYAYMDMQEYKIALQLLHDAVRYTYKKEFRAYSYKMTYIKAHLLLFTGNSALSHVENAMALALLQMKKYFTHERNEIFREPYLISRLEQFQNRSKIFSELWSMSDGFEGKSYFRFKNIDFPVI